VDNLTGFDDPNSDGCNAVDFQHGRHDRASSFDEVSPKHRRVVEREDVDPDGCPVGSSHLHDVE